MLIKLSMVRGIIILMPLGLVAYIVWNIFSRLNAAGEWPLLKILTRFDPSWEKFVVPGAGIMLIATICYVIGRMSLKEGNFINKIMEKIPIIKILFGKNDDILNSTPCQFWPTPTVKKEGFIVGFQKITGKKEDDVIVYWANPPLLITGETFNVPKEFAIKLANSPREILNKLLFFGKVKPEELFPIPWDCETEKEFYVRINSTPMEIEMRKFLKKDGSQ